MKKLNTRLLSAILAAVLFLSCCPVVSLASGGFMIAYEGKKVTEISVDKHEKITVTAERAPEGTLQWQIKIPGTKVDYPVMQTPDRTDYYLKRNFEKKRSAAGSIYVREQCDVFAPSDNLTIYGHRMNSGSMFGQLMNYKKVEFWAENRYIYFDTLTHRGTYEIFAVFKISASVNNGFQYHLFVDMDQEKFAEFVEQCKTRSLYDTGVTAEYGDQLITLVTCAYHEEFGRFVVVARQQQ